MTKYMKLLILILLAFSTFGLYPVPRTKNPMNSGALANLKL